MFVRLLREAVDRQIAEVSQQEINAYWNALLDFLEREAQEQE